MKFISSNFWYGFLNAFNLFPYHKSQKKLSKLIPDTIDLKFSYKNDTEALKSDWEKVGIDIWKSYEINKQELEFKNVLIKIKSK